METYLFWLVPAASLLALALAGYFYRQMKQESEGTPTMARIASYVRKGAMSYLKQQYKIVTLVFIGLAALFAIMAYGFNLQNHWVPVAFLTGGFFSGLSGYLGMKTATYASARTANAARNSLNKGLKVAFRSGAVMGLVVVGLGLFDISFWYLLLDFCIPEDALNPTAKLCVITTTMLTFGMGASTQALFARVGGGIYTKAADVGADLVGKVEAGIPEDDPRNPATIADNVGDNVGDVAGMGADLYESYCGSILATAALGAAAYIGTGDTAMQFKAVIAPMLIAAVGIILSIIGIFAVRTKENACMRELLKALSTGTNLSAGLIVIATFSILWVLQIDNWLYISLAVVIGLIVGIVIGQSTEFYTSQSYKPTQKLAESGKTGPATVIISGIGLGMVSTTIPVIAVVAGIILSYWLASGFDFTNISMGLYGIGIAAVGMLSTLGITLATDAYGPIADNAGGNAEMSGLGAEVRKRTDALDSLGNTTAATGKGFAIGSAALTGLALLASYIEEIRIGLERIGTTVLELPNGLEVMIQEAGFTDFMMFYDVTLMNPKVLSGMFIGSMMAFLFCGLTMNAVGRAAAHMVEEVRRQFREIKGILEGKTEPDYARCVQISTLGAQKEMVFPSLLAIIAPIVTGLLFGVPGVIGLLIGGLSSGFILAIFMANSGGAWDNAKKYVEEGNFGGKGSEVHRATVVGDTVGDPFKDTSGPSLNILIKLMSMVAIVMAGLTVSWSLF
ncbi:sodium-translocating pyrophosphatase [Phocaeicola plebeius]|jgi:K(+)-stimulated pyrophosphate-energized sodium pump|uniref:sodium-translocating pyrophosphatase n=1 Tax=Phocaeicola plebeius TaxID=310297 RepID=UPI00241BF2D9|nr:sodium-translocating pyrophosphatase [Phocaeicola plebeius]